jgi:acetoin utilization protein AcuB
MLVRDRMTRPVITIHPDMPLHDAINLLRAEKVRRLPVVDRHGRLVGIVSERDLLHAAPSAATSLSVWEVHYLLSKVTIDQIMTRSVITIADDTPIEEAARIMVDRKIGGLPVMAGNELVGIITETDLFKIFLELLGARERAVRVSALVNNVPGELARVTKAIFEAGGNILALGTFMGESTADTQVLAKVDGVSPEALRAALEPNVKRIVDLRGPHPS